jgi:polysaccharide pyruvyl transferase WcaK-like protein
MHALIIASTAGVPIIGISHVPKLKDFLYRVDRGSCCIDIQELSFERLALIVDNTWNQRTGIRKQLNTKIPEIVEQAHVSEKLVQRLLE